MREEEGERTGGKRRNSSKLTFLFTKGKALYQVDFAEFSSFSRCLYVFKEVHLNFQSGFYCTGMKMESYTLGPVSLVQVMVGCLPAASQGPGKSWYRLGQRRSTTWLSIQGRGHGCGIC